MPGISLINSARIAASLRLARQAQSGGGTPTPTPMPITPLNWDMIGFMDSRGDNAVGGTLAPAVGGAGYVASINNIGFLAWLPLVSNNRIVWGRYPNFSVSACTTQEAAAVPRRSASGTTTPGAATASTPPTWFRGVDSTNKGADYAALHPAGIVPVLLGTNDGNRNASTQYATTSRANILTILNNLRADQLKIVYNEVAKGKKIDGSTTAPVSQDFLDYSAWLSSLDYASGSPNARSDVIVVDSMGLTLDVATGYNKQGYLRDGLHTSPWGGRELAVLTDARLASVFGSIYTAQPSRLVLPTANGLVTPSAVAPFVHTNPILTPGTNGTVQGSNFASAPLASTIPQGWVIANAGVGGGLTVSCDKTGTAPDGFPMTTITIGGTLADASTVTNQFYQLALAAGQLTINDLLQGVGMIRILPGSVGLSGVRIRAHVASANTNRTQTATAMNGSAGGSGDRIGYHINSNGYDAGGDWMPIQTQILNLQDPNMDIANGGPGVMDAITQAGIWMESIFNNFTGASMNVNATIQVSRLGMRRIL